MNRSRSSLLFVALLAMLLLSACLFGNPGDARADDLSQSIQKTGKEVARSVKHGLKKTGDYLKSKKFHQDARRFADDTGKAVKNAGDWIGQKIDSMKK